MHSVREIAKSIIAEMEGTRKERSPVAALHYRRMAVISYADFLKRSPERTEETNQRCLEEAWIFAHKAISYGEQESRIEESFDRLRAYWLPRLKGSVCQEK